MPAYQFQRQADVLDKYDMLITTEQEILLKYQGFFLIPPIIGREDIKLLYRYLSQRFDDMTSEMRKRKRENFVKEIRVSKNTFPDWNMDTIIGRSHDGQMSYHTFDQDKVYICRIASDQESAVFLYKLDETVLFLRKRMKKMVYVSYCPGNQDAFVFFDMVSDVLNEMI